MNVAIAVTAGALNVGNEVRKVMGRSQLTPPRIASTRSQTIAPMTIDPNARIAMERIRFLRFRMF